MRQYRTQMLVGVAMVALLLAGVLAVSVDRAEPADATAFACVKAPFQNGLELRLSGLDGVAGTYAVRQNDRYHSTSETLTDSFIEGSVEDDWTLRLRGPEIPDPYLTLPCLLEADALCTVIPTDDGARLEFNGLDEADRIAVRKNGRWLANTTGASASLRVDGGIDDTWELRIRGTRWTSPFESTTCLAPATPPVGTAFCQVIETGLVWSNAEVDSYQVRKDGAWVTETRRRAFETDDLDAQWLIRYRSAGRVVDEPCVSADDVEIDPAGPCLFDGELVESVLNGAQCDVIARSLGAEGSPLPTTDPCDRSYPVLCVDGTATWLWLSVVPTAEDLAAFPDVRTLYVVPITDDVHDLTAVTTMTELEYLYVASLTMEELPRDIGRLENLLELRILEAPQLTRLPDEIGELTKLISLHIGEHQGLRDRVEVPIERLPDSIGDLVYLRELELEGTNISVLPASITGLVSLSTLDVSDTLIRGDLAAQQLVLGDPEDVPFDIIWWNGEGDCPVWTTNTTWNAWQLRNDPTWSDCQTAR